MRSGYKHYNSFRYFTAFLLALLLIFRTPLPAFATQEELLDEAEERKSEPVETNDIEGWPQGPAIGAAGAVVMDAESGAVLYGKNMNKHLYPASITKLMTALSLSFSIQKTPVRIIRTGASKCLIKRYYYLALA